MARSYHSVCYCTNLRMSAGILTDYYDQVLADAGLNVTQYRLLINLQRMGSANIMQWAQQVALERSTMVRNTKLLHQKGWIKECEGRGKQFRLTEFGEETLAQAAPLWEKAQQKLESFLGKEDAEAVLRIGTKLQTLDELPL